MLVPLATSGCIVQHQNFWNAIFLYHDRPHIINRKLVGYSLVYIYEINYNNLSMKLSDCINYISLTYETKKLKELTKDSLKNLIESLLLPYDKNVSIKETNIEECKNSLDGIYISVRILYPTNDKIENCVELIIFNKEQNVATFLASCCKTQYSLVAPPFPYSLEFTSSGHVKLVIDLEDADSSSAEWLADKLFPKFIKWATEYDESLLNLQSLSLISLGRYCSLYKNLKKKYGENMVKYWPENTDPLKYVYEDVAIASYLICLWESISPGKKPSFVDLGCGNGLLVYILTEEGFPGVGIDVRKRKIWDMYPMNIKLETKTIVPSSSALFPDTDWIIGNHSDELTPWIPVIAARSSYKTNFFVLPCCSYDFNGHKYFRLNSNKSQYSEYLEYIEEVSNKCGFNVQIDKLRIPSTKRICLISNKRTYDFNEFKTIDVDITNLINMRCGSNLDSATWVKDFQPRENVEKVRNCTQLDKDLINKIVQEVVQELLKHKNMVTKNDNTDWNAGTKLFFPNLINVLNSDDLKQLKNECGGLQTLLKNHRYIFEVVKGTIKLRIPILFKDVKKYKDKPCWFFKNHPDGCINDNYTCGYKH